MESASTAQPQTHLPSRALAAADPRLRAAAALCATALATVRRDIGLLVAEADEVLKGVGGVESASTAQPQTHLPFLPTAPLEAALYNAKKSLLR